MASKGNVPSGEKSRFRFILVEGEVSPGELQQFAQTLAAAVKPPQQVIAYPQLPAAPAGTPLAARPAEQPNLFNGVVPEEEPEPAPEPAAATKPQNGASKKKLRTPQLVSGLEFTNGEKPLTEYIKEIDPQTHSIRYLAITYWLRQYRAIAEVSGDHIYTCYRALGLNVPRDVGSILRALKSQEWLEKGSSDGLYKITHIGEGQLNKAA